MSSALMGLGNPTSVVVREQLWGESATCPTLADSVPRSAAH